MIFFAASDGFIAISSTIQDVVLLYLDSFMACRSDVITSRKINIVVFL
jgi:hypothetical protein